MGIYHASCVDWEGKGIIICGHSGSGKSDLALRLIDDGAVLVADDRVALGPNESCLMAEVPEKIKGLLEVRGLGIVPMPFQSKTVVRLKIVLKQACEIDRMPDLMFETIEGVEIPLLLLDPKMPSAVAKIKLALSVHAGERKVVS